MQVSPSLLFTAAGLASGMFASSLLSKWLSLIHTTISKHGGDFLGAPKRRLLWALPFVLFLHPGAWPIGIAVVLTVRVISGALNLDWLWFLGGFYGILLLIYGTVLVTYRRVHSHPTHRVRT
jgi:hypothetical protein